MKKKTTVKLNTEREGARLIDWFVLFYFNSISMFDCDRNVRDLLYYYIKLVLLTSYDKYNNYNHNYRERDYYFFSVY